MSKRQVGVAPRLIMITLLALLGVTGCATSTSSPADAPQRVFNDALFEPPSTPIPDAGDIFYLTPAQLLMLDDLIRPRMGTTGARQLVNKLFKKDYSEFDYDNSFTRSASLTLDQRAGNCLSMVIMTAAIAKHFRIPYRYQDIKSTPMWDREGELYLINGHINIRLLTTVADKTPLVYNPLESKSITVDFIPQATRRGIARRVIGEQRVVAMYYANLAADEMVRHNWSQAYWLLREALRSDGGYDAAWNNLGVIYRNIGEDGLAELAYRHSLKLVPGNDNAVSNLVLLLRGQQRFDEMFELQRLYDLAQLNNPFYYFDQAEIAYAEGDYHQAISLYKKAIKRSDFVDRFYFGLFKANWQLKRFGQAKKYLQLAEENSQDLKDRRRYNVKLGLLNEGLVAGR